MGGGLHPLECPWTWMWWTAIFATCFAAPDAKSRHLFPHLFGKGKTEVWFVSVSSFSRFWAHVLRSALRDVGALGKKKSAKVLFNFPGSSAFSIYWKDKTVMRAVEANERMTRAELGVNRFKARFTVSLETQSNFLHPISSSGFV